uniref:Uncharacterized protein n=1 Tax=Cyprinodon variegatus TaxID=28743 RepID=A0A3Q2G5H0_CYPVA
SVPPCSGSSRLESVGEDDELLVESSICGIEAAEKPPTGRRKHSLPQQLDATGVRQEYQIIKKSARSLSTIQVESPWRLAQPSIISSIVLMKGQGKVSALLRHICISKTGCRSALWHSALRVRSFHFLSFPFGCARSR